MTTWHETLLLSLLSGGYNYDSTSIGLSKIIKVTAT